MKNGHFYDDAHLVTAAVRVLEHQKGAPPSIEDVCGLLAFSAEQGNLICNRLHDLGALEVTRGAFGTKVFIRDHLQLEQIPRDRKERSLQEEIEKFKSSRKDISQEIEAFKAKQDEKKKKLFADLSGRLKK